MAFSFDDYRRAAADVKKEHELAVDDCLEKGKLVADAEATYRSRRMVAVEEAKSFHGATVAEAIGDGQPEVVEAAKALAIRKARDRAAVQRVRLAEADRQILLTLGSWSKSQEAAE